MMLIGAISMGCYNRIVHFISEISMEMYLSHMAVFRGIEKLHLNVFLGNGFLGYVITVFAVLTCTVIFSVVMKKLLEIIEKKLEII
jgi:peptidoglycan/LPS O-acetylase OafA/YrhL